MNKWVIVAIVVVVVGSGALGGYMLSTRQQKTTPAPFENQIVDQKALPSTSLKEYTDSSGFSFSYPDNLSLKANEVDNATYADLTLSSEDIDGALHIVIADTKLKSTDDWVKSLVGSSSIDSLLGTLKAKEVKNNDGVKLGIIDQAVLFTLDTSFNGQESYWQKVYDEVRTSFAFNAVSQSVPAQGGTAGESSDVEFEGEEVVE